MRGSRLRLDLGLLKQGVSIGVEFGIGSLEGLARTAEFLEHSVYERGSLTWQPDRLTFTLLNPPLRMGAFDAMRIRINGAPVPSAGALVAPEGAPAPTRFSESDSARPVALPVGRRTRFTVVGPVPPDRPVHVRLELHSVAIPPTVSLEFVDTPHPVAP